MLTGAGAGEVGTADEQCRGVEGEALGGCVDDGLMGRRVGCERGVEASWQSSSEVYLQLSTCREDRMETGGRGAPLGQ